MGFWQPEDERYLRETLLWEAKSLGVPLSDEKIASLKEQLRLVLEANREVNLTAVTDVKEAVVKHLVDSMTFYPEYHERQGRYLDMGTGAGYPGMVLEILEPREGVLLDSVAKKIRVCEAIGKRLGLSNIRYVAERVEDFASEPRESVSFGVVTARAVAPLGVLIEYAQPLLKMDGVLVVSKGGLSQVEERQGQQVAELVGMESVSRETLELPDDMGKRTLMVFQKTGDSHIQLPRRIGRAVKQPLWKRYHRKNIT